MSTSVAEMLDHYRPTSIDAETWAIIKPLTHATITIVAPPTVGAARRNLALLVCYLQWIARHRSTLDPAAVFEPRQVKQFIALARNKKIPGRALTDSTVNELASRLVAIGRQVNPNAAWPAKTVGTTARRLQDPYTTAHMSMALNAMTATNTDMDTHARRAFFILAGTGITAGEYCQLNHSALQHHKGDLVVRLPDRTVPVAAPYRHHLAALGLPANQGGLVVDRRGKNRLSSVFARAPIGTDRLVLNAGRLRTTWMVHRIYAGVSLPAVAHYAGLTSLSFVVDLADYLPTHPEEQEWVALTAEHP